MSGRGGVEEPPVTRSARMHQRPGVIQVINPGGEFPFTRPNDDRIRRVARIDAADCAPCDSSTKSTCGCGGASATRARALGPGSRLTRVCEPWEYSSEPTDAAAVWALARSWTRSERLAQYPSPTAMGELGELVTAKSARALSRALLVESFAGPSYLLHPRSEAVITGEE